MVIEDSRLENVPVFSLQTGRMIARTARIIVDPDKLKIVGFAIPYGRQTKILSTMSIREFSRVGMVIDSVEELVDPDDIIQIKKILSLNFNLIGLKVETRKKTHLGKVAGFSCTDDNFMIQQIRVKKPTLRSFTESELLIPRKEIVEITDYKVIIKDEEKTIREKAESDFVPNFVNPFRDGIFAEKTLEDK